MECAPNISTEKQAAHVLPVAFDDQAIVARDAPWGRKHCKAAAWQCT
jgi:hypothetical protein